MTRRFLLCLLTLPLFILAHAGSPAPKGYRIGFACKPYRERAVSLAHYLGEEFKLDAAGRLNATGEVVFEGDARLQGGMYVLLLEGQQYPLDFLIDTTQHFSISAEFDSTGYLQKVIFANSPENDLLYRYKHFMAGKQQHIYMLQSALASAATAADSVASMAQLEGVNKAIQQYRDSLAARYPGSLLGVLLSGLREPLLPEPLLHPAREADSTAAKYYTKIHFWDGVNFKDSRLVFTPLLNGKMNRYFSEIVEPRTDSAIKYIDQMMKTAISSNEMTQLVLSKLLYGSMYHRFKWDAPVFLHLYDTYIAKKSPAWLTADERKTFDDQARLLKSNIKDAPAAAITLPGLDDAPASLHSVEAAYTVLCFWDPTCDHCVETLPVLDSLYRAKWKAKGFKVYAVAVESDGNREGWLNFIKSKHLEEWTNVYDAVAAERALAAKGDIPIVRKYDVWYFPSFFLLDRNKHFLAKKQTWPQLKELVNDIIK